MQFSMQQINIYEQKSCLKEQFEESCSHSIQGEIKETCLEIEAIQSEYIEKFSEFQTSFNVDFEVEYLFVLFEISSRSWKCSHNFDICDEIIS